MYGDSGFTFPLNPTTGIADASQLKQAFLGRGKMIQPNWTQAENTTISAVITLVIIKPFLMELGDLRREDCTIDYEAELRKRIPDFDPQLEVPRVIVWHNAVARTRFPANMFCGAYDTHYGITMAEQDATFEGEAVPDRLKLFKPRKP